MIKEAIEKVIALAVPNFHSIGNLEYSDKLLHLIKPPQAETVECSTLQGLVDLYDGEFNSLKTHGAGSILVHITSPQSVAIIDREADDHGCRLEHAHAKFPEVKGFP